MMMMIAPYCLVCQKEGAQGEEEEEAGGRRRGGQTGIPMPDADVPTGPTRLEMSSDARNRRKHGRWCGVLIHRRGIGARDQSYPLTIGMEEDTGRKSKL